MGKRLTKMIFEEEKKKDEKNEKLMIELCECCLMFNERIYSIRLISACVPCLLKVALRKDESMEAQKEVEMSLLALSSAIYSEELRKEQYLNEITEVIQYHQEHRNLTRLADQSAWMFFIECINCDKKIESEIVNELQFSREAAKELEELEIYVEWKKNGKSMSELKEIEIIRRWYSAICFNIQKKIRTQENGRLIASMIRMCGKTKNNYRCVYFECAMVFEFILNGELVDYDDL
ncbi:uncharacterized protein MONOS_18093 [Monocercomonoides exilis]|uniref:uncharacterized protein n=1 Tax=Monocercomonoides exilis TaxID=2049356 RepID=UPI003559B669|nr:hypothetical protein MONOS_18093 [Monocercomonoides exilis]